MPQELLMDLQLPNPEPQLQIQLRSRLPLSLCGCLCPAVIDFESFFNWQHTGQSRAMDSRTAGGRGRGVTGAWTGAGGVAGLFVFAFDKLFACKVNEGPGQ